MARSLRLVVVLGSTLWPALVAAAPKTRFHQGQRVPRVTTGVLSAARQAPAAQIAREHLERTLGVRSLELAAAETHELGALRVVRFAQTVAGLPVVGGG